MIRTEYRRSRSSKKRPRPWANSTSSLTHCLKSISTISEIQMREKVIKIVDRGSSAGCPIRFACLVLVIAVTICYEFVFYYLPLPYIWILMGQQAIICIWGVIGAVTCSQCFIKLYIVKQILLLLTILAIIGVTIYNLFYNNYNNCPTDSDDCDNDFYKGWLHITGVRLSWIVMITATVGTGLFILTICSFRGLSGIQKRKFRFGYNSRFTRNNKTGCIGDSSYGNVVSQPIEQNPQTTVVINQSMPMMEGFMSDPFFGFVPMMMPQADQTQNIFTMPTEFPTLSTSNQDEQQNMINQNQLLMAQYYSWFCSMPMMMPEQIMLPLAVPNTVDKPLNEAEIVQSADSVIASH